ncbi:undecaprenyl-diphosphate phosphatase [Flavihumibacter petaseus]|uniref:Undecaprenyl-diphosphatase n=1 Tax=Flavihumibacter petaseus NBRC 106054 TaxID=1220578 RepID=A0A0E9N519_9BACT|nr:undecaprenyl-diphosphate phosphatase [Flavihumibacter petaseus]GAO45062.1 undecaprenyl-diphosphatase [Flavihumibacter petaseus NBRC 106054]
MTIVEAVIIAIVEGLTEFLPVSSTGHMIIASSLMGIEKDAFTKLFEVAIQLGAIMAVVVLYWKKFFDFKRPLFYVKLAVAVIPALVLGYLFSDKIDAMLESPLTVALSLLLGGLVLVWIDRAFQRPGIHEEENISFGKAFIIGCWQCLAMIPGVSRSASSIIGGMQQKLDRNLAAEFSFFLAVPTMAAATAHSLILKDWELAPGVKSKGYEMLLGSTDKLVLFIVGNVVAFAVAWLAIRFFIGFLQRHGFRWFGYYRIAAGVILLILLGLKVIQ